MDEMAEATILLEGTRSDIEFMKDRIMGAIADICAKYDTNLDATFEWRD